MTAQGFLMVTMEPAAGDEHEFHDWYDTEHVPERAAIKGFLNAQRFVCTQGWPRYVATYDLTSLSVLAEPGYVAVSGDRFSPWSKRILSRVHGLYRVEGLQVSPGKATMGDKGKPTGLVILRFRNARDDMAPAILAGLKATYGIPAHLQTRLFKSSYDQNDFVALVELRTPPPSTDIDPSVFGPAAECLDMVNAYTPYWRHGRLHGVLSK